LVGTVTDTTGAVVAGAAVRATNTERSFVYQGETTPNGDYYIPYLTSGTYRLEVEADGFKKSVQEGIVLRTNETPRFNIQLELGSITESITVDATPPLLELKPRGPDRCWTATWLSKSR